VPVGAAGLPPAVLPHGARPGSPPGRRSVRPCSRPPIALTP
jgi:hypothetical protein